jgi:hypothetical protein
MDRGARFSSCNECYMDRLGFVGFHLAVSLANVAVVDSVEVGRSAAYSRYNNIPRTLPWGTPALTGESSVYSVSAYKRKCLLCK